MRVNFDWNAFNAAHGIGKNELRALGKKSGAKNANEAIQANNAAFSPMAFGNAFLGNNYSVSAASNTSRIDASSVKRTGNPDQDAKNFAKKMGISVDEAKNQLRAMFGNPEAKKAEDSTSSQKTSDNPFSNKIDESKVKMTGNPDTDAKNFAKKMNISVEEAKKQLKAQYGDPTQKSSSSSSSASTTSSTTKTSDTTTKTSDSTTKTTSSTTKKSNSTDGSSEFTKDASGRHKLEQTIKYWNAKLKEATDAKDNSGVAYARKQCEKYQTLARKWDKG